MAMNCPNCGSVVADDAKFCPACGRALGPYYAQTSIEPPQQTISKTVSTAVSVAVVIIVIIVIIAVLAWLFSSTIISERHGSVAITVHNNSWFFSNYYSLYIDGELEYSQTAGAGEMWTSQWEVTWHGGSTHTSTVTVVWGGTQASQSVVVIDGQTVSCHVDIGM